MKQHIIKFNNHNDYTTFLSSSNYITPNVSLCVAENEVHYNPYVHNYAEDYLTFVAKENGTFTFTPQNNNVISYSTDEGDTWTVGNSVQVNSGDKVMWKGEMIPVYSSPNYGIGSFKESTNSFDVQGNIMSLLYGDNFKNQTDLSGKNFAFYQLFCDTNIINAENLSLPATTLAYSCYKHMFAGCKNLTTAPSVLPATTLLQSCYSSMFNNCTSLILAPELPATTLAADCYVGMFQGCTSLTIAPELPATTLATNCYNSMFNGCTNLTVAPELLATTLAVACYYLMFRGCTNLSSITCLASNIPAENCTYNWVNGVAANGIFVKAAAMSGWTTGNNGIPSGWTVQDYSE